MKRYCLLLDLKDNPELIAAYEAHHRAVWPEIQASIRDSGISNMTIYRWGNRLAMWLETTDEFSFALKAAADELNPKVQEWEALMWTFQQALPGTPPGSKWVLAEPIFQFDSDQE